jgi:hypothetical protein
MLFGEAPVVVAPIARRAAGIVVSAGFSCVVLALVAMGVLQKRIEPHDTASLSSVEINPPQ